MHNDVITEEKLGNLNILVYPDYDVESPREWDNIATLVCQHRNYRLGDEQDVDGALTQLLFDHMLQHHSRTIVKRFLDLHPGYVLYYGDGLECTAEYLITEVMDAGEKLDLLMECDDIYVTPISYYEHGDITIWCGRPNDPWDSGYLGFAYITREKAMKNGAPRKWRQWASERIQSEVSVYDTYLQGECCGYVVEDDNGEEVDSCWGFFSAEEAIEYAKDAVSA